jgi:NAD(P)-dependent dehydrogenase (short-subunit alcohol dehydrogenase family)
MEMRMNGRNALVTGGSLGIGRAIAEHFARCGANVAIVARGAAALARAKTEIAAVAPGKVIDITADVATADGCRHAFETAQGALGPLDVLINNAGTSQRGAFTSLSDETWQHDLDLKLFAAIRLCRLALPGMQARRWGRIINVLNTGAKAPGATSAPTSVTRAAGMALTKVLAAEGAANNVLVNAVLVGRIASDQWVRRHAAENKGRSLEAFYADMGRGIPLGRIGTAEEFANMVLFLASDAGSYITGTAINIDGGLSPVV